VISPELARELKVAQLPWRPRRGDLVVDRLNIPYLVLKDGTDEDGAVEIDTPQGVDRRPFLGLTWLPHLEQLLSVLARHGAFQLEAMPAGQGRKDVRWQVTVHAAGAGQALSFSGSDPAETAGKALHHLLGETGWRPGRAV
jgi:hypothetical protein